MRVDVAFSAITFASSPSFADTLIKVTESGEAGGALTLELDQQSAKAGPATFNIHNDAAAEEHEMVLVKLKSADEKISVNKKKDRVVEKLESLGKVEGLKPGQHGELKANLRPGTYLLLCNIKGHYSAGNVRQDDRHSLISKPRAVFSSTGKRFED